MAGSSTFNKQKIDCTTAETSSLRVMPSSSTKVEGTFIPNNCHLYISYCTYMLQLARKGHEDVEIVVAAKQKIVGNALIVLTK